MGEVLKMDIYERIDDILRQKENLQDELIELLKEKEALEKEEHDRLLYLPITLAQKPFLSVNDLDGKVSIRIEFK